MRKIIVGLLLVGLCFNLLFLPQARAGQFFGGEIEKKPSVIYYGKMGCLIGMLAGVSTGYLVIMDRDDSKEENSKTGVRHMSYGAIGGTVLGLGIGLYEISRSRSGTGAVVLRDMKLGSLMGMTIGLFSGFISYSTSDDWDDVGMGVAWGNLGGILLGGVLGFIEAPRVLNEAKSLPGWMPYASVKICKDKEKSYPFYAINFVPVRF